MKIRLLPALLLPLLLSDCGDNNGDTATTALSPQEMYEKGRALMKPNVEQASSDAQQALGWIQQAAEGGFARAQLDLGGLYMYGGKDIEADGAKALRWFSRAAQQGSREAEYFIGELYRCGQGVPADAGKAMEHWRIAAEAGIAEAQQRLGHALVQSEASFDEGLTWLFRAATEGAANGKAEAACDLGNIYARGKAGVQANMEKAAHWYGIAAEGGSVKAQFIYALLLLDGDVIPRDEEAGMFMLRRAASQDYIPAMAEFIRQLLTAPNATPEQQQEADAWNKRLIELQEKQKKQPAGAGR